MVSCSSRSALGPRSTYRAAKQFGEGDGGREVLQQRRQVGWTVGQLGLHMWHLLQCG